MRRSIQLPTCALCLTLAQGCTGVDCTSIPGLNRDQYTACFETDIEWAETGVHEVDGHVRSVSWLDHGETTEQNLVNWIPDDHWLREVVVFEHRQDDPSETSGEDVAVGYLQLSCEWDRSLLEGNHLYTTERLREGSVSEVLVSCSDWPAAIVAETDRPAVGACYEALLCPMGTLCHDVESEEVCPDTGWMCTASEPETAWVDLDRDGLGNCSDDDIDGDGLTNDEEQDVAGDGFASDPWSEDTDGDGLSDSSDPYPTMTCDTEVLFADTFVEDPAASWAGAVGAWEWDGGVYTATSELRDHQVVWLGARDWDDYTVETRLRFTYENGSGGLVFRAQSISNYEDSGLHYYAALDPYRDLVFLGYTDGVATVELAQAPLVVETGVWYALQVEVSGEVIAVSVDQEPALEVEDATFAVGSVGLRVVSVYAEVAFDYLVVCD